MITCELSHYELSDAITGKYLGCAFNDSDLNKRISFFNNACISVEVKCIPVKTYYFCSTSEKKTEISSGVYYDDED